jgi:hypothetical protein
MQTNEHIRISEDETCMEIRDLVEPLEKISYVFPKNITKLIIVDSEILLLEGSRLPDTLTTLIYKNNKTQFIINLREGLKNITIYCNDISSLVIPNSVVFCDLNQNRSLVDISYGSSIKDIDLTLTCIKNIDNLPTTIENLTANLCVISQINKLPPNLKSFIAQNSDIKEINCDFPPSLSYLDLTDNSELTKMPPISHIGTVKIENTDDDDDNNNDIDNNENDSDNTSVEEYVTTDGETSSNIIEQHSSAISEITSSHQTIFSHEHDTDVITYTLPLTTGRIPVPKKNKSYVL